MRGGRRRGGRRFSNKKRKKSRFSGKGRHDGHKRQRRDEGKEIVQKNGPKLTEKDCAIVSYTDLKVPGFTGILKHRYSDFLVREVTPDGNVLSLTDAPKPSDFVKKVDKTSSSVEEMVESGLKELETLLGEDAVKDLREFVKDEDRASKNVSLPHVADKDVRRKIHHIVRENLGSLQLETNTFLLNRGTPEETKRIRVYVSRRGGGKKQNRGEFRNSNAPWPAPGTDYIHFTLYKENVDTIRAVENLSRILHVNSKIFTYAGTKDKRAITCQRVCAYRVTKEKLARVNECERAPIRVGNFEYAKTQLSLGALQGNRFDIILREICAVEGDKSTDSIENIVKTAVEALGRNGFLNYFGLQRFGRGSSSTNGVGAAILRKDWTGAVKMILKGSIEDMELDLKDKDSVSKALTSLPRYGTQTEYKILKTLCQGKNAFDAISSVPFNVRRLYVHAFQSYLWNLSVTTRFQRYGLSVVKGDLVGTRREIEIKDGEVAMSSFEKEYEIHVVTDEDVNSNKYNIFDVILPLGGYDVKFPEHDVGRDWFESELAKLSVRFEDLGSREKRGPFSLTGAYRHAFQKAVDLDWELIRYSGVDESLSESDVDKLRGSQEKKRKEGDESSKKMEEGQEKTRLALRIAFTLRKSSYATMLLRELTKCSSQTDLHKRATQKVQHAADVVAVLKKEEDKIEVSEMEVDEKTKVDVKNNTTS